MDVIITTQKVTIHVSQTKAYSLKSTLNAFGNLVAELENKFPEIRNISGDEYGNMIVDRLSNKLSGSADGEEHIENLWGLNISADNAYGVLNFADFFDGSNKIKLTMQAVEIWRIRHFVEKSASPLDWFNASYDAGIHMDGVTSVCDIAYALLYYYAMNGLNLVKCEHCGRWFATDSFKHKFCNRRSPVPGYDKLNCEQAVQNIRQQCARVRNRIDTKAGLTAATGGSPFQDWFWHECNRRTEAIKKQASAERQIEYLGFLKDAENSKAWLDNSCMKSDD